jgi:hypothetical protein
VGQRIGESQQLGKYGQRREGDGEPDEEASMKASLLESVSTTLFIFLPSKGTSPSLLDLL